MASTINIELSPGGNKISLPAWATEDTLQSILKQLDLNTRDMKFIKQIFDAIEAGTETFETGFAKIAQNLNDMKGDFEKLGAASTKLSGAFSKTFSTLENTDKPIQSMYDLTTQAASLGGDLVGSVAGAFGSIGSIKDKIDKFGTDHMNMTNSLWDKGSSAVGAVAGAAGAWAGLQIARMEKFADSQSKLIDAGAFMFKREQTGEYAYSTLFSRLANLGVGYSEFAETVKQHSATFAKMGDNVTEGADFFVLGLENMAGRAAEFGYYGLPIKEYQEAYADYMDTLVNSGQYENLAAQGMDKLNMSFHDWMIESQGMAAVLGISAAEQRRAHAEAAAKYGGAAKIMEEIGMEAQSQRSMFVNNINAELGKMAGMEHLMDPIQEYNNAFQMALVQAGGDIDAAYASIQSIAPEAYKTITYMLQALGGPDSELGGQFQAMMRNMQEFQANSAALTKAEQDKFNNEWLVGLKVLAQDSLAVLDPKSGKTNPFVLFGNDQAFEASKILAESFTTLAQTLPDELAEPGADVAAIMKRYREQAEVDSKEAAGSTGIQGQAKIVLLKAMDALTADFEATTDFVKPLLDATNRHLDEVRNLQTINESAVETGIDVITYTVDGALKQLAESSQDAISWTIDWLHPLTEEERKLEDAGLYERGFVDYAQSIVYYPLYGVNQAVEWAVGDWFRSDAEAWFSDDDKEERGDIDILAPVTIYDLEAFTKEQEDAIQALVNTLQADAGRQFQMITDEGWIWDTDMYIDETAFIGELSRNAELKASYLENIKPKEDKAKQDLYDKLMVLGKLPRGTTREQAEQMEQFQHQFKQAQQEAWNDMFDWFEDNDLLKDDDDPLVAKELAQERLQHLMKLLEEVKSSDTEAKQKAIELLLEEAGQLDPDAPRRARGGPIRPGQQYMVGENEAEMFVSATPGMILNQQQLEALTNFSGSHFNIMRKFDKVESRVRDIEYILDIQDDADKYAAIMDEVRSILGYQPDISDAIDVTMSWTESEFSRQYDMINDILYQTGSKYSSEFSRLIQEQDAINQATMGRFGHVLTAMSELSRGVETDNDESMTFLDTLLSPLYGASAAIADAMIGPLESLIAFTDPTGTIETQRDDMSRFLEALDTTMSIPEIDQDELMKMVDGNDPQPFLERMALLRKDMLDFDTKLQYNNESRINETPAPAMVPVEPELPDDSQDLIISTLKEKIDALVERERELVESSGSMLSQFKAMVNTMESIRRRNSLT